MITHLPPTTQVRPWFQVRNPSCQWRKQDPDLFKHAYITLRVVTTEGQTIERTAIIGRAFKRGGERTYENITPASLKRLSNLFPFPIL